MCICDDWQKGKKALDNLVTLAFVHGVQYDGPKWTYCPWCGLPLLKRIQRKREKGWKMPPNTVYVGRPTKYANYADWRKLGRVEAVNDFCRQLDNWKQDDPEDFQQMLDELRGKNLACWCRLIDEDGTPIPCHADILLELANR